MSRFMQPGRGVCVDGDEVEIKRACCFRVDVIGGEDTPDFAIGVRLEAPGTFRGGDDLITGVDLMLTSAEGLTCV